MMGHPFAMRDWSRHFRKRDRRQSATAWAVVGLFALGPSLTGALAWVLA